MTRVKPIWKDGHESATKVDRRKRVGERLGRAEVHERVRADQQHPLLREQRKQRVEQPCRAQRAAQRHQRVLSAGCEVLRPFSTTGAKFCAPSAPRGAKFRETSAPRDTILLDPPPSFKAPTLTGTVPELPFPHENPISLTEIQILHESYAGHMIYSFLSFPLFP